MALLIVFLLIVGGAHYLGYMRGERIERIRHTRAVDEAVENIASIRDWRRDR
jgi:hypothetical protein